MSDQKDNSDIIDIEPENITENAAGHPDAKPATAFKSNAGRLALGVALILASAIAGGWLYRDLLASYLPSDQVQSMTARVEALEGSAKTANGKLEAVVGLTDEIKSQLGAALSAAQDADKLANSLKADSANSKNNAVTLQTALTKLSATVDEMKVKLKSGSQVIVSGDSSGLSDRVNILEKNVASLKQESGALSSDKALLSQAMTNLQSKLMSGANYQTDLDTVQRLAPDADGLAELSSGAASGLPDAPALALELKSIANSFPKEGPDTAPVDDSWFGSAVNMVSGLVTVKNAGITDWSALATQTATLAEQGDLAGAIAALSKTENDLPPALQSWKEKATARLALEHALEKTWSAILRRNAAKG
jgi:hypothetical protein